MTSALSALFWGLLVLSVLVFVHEGGHFLAARALGVRVTEFFLGMPSRVRASFVSERYGTEFGVTPLLLGGYNRICGMEGQGSEHMAAVLAAVQEAGTIDVRSVAGRLGLDVEDVANDLEVLAGWGSIAYLGAPEGAQELDVGSDTYATLRRDGRGRCAYDREHDFAGAGVTEAGAPHPVDDADAFLAQERSHTFEGRGFLGRLAILLAGPAVNILLAFVMVTCFFWARPYEVIVDTNVLGDVVEGGLAWEAGVRAGDAITDVAGASCESWGDVYDALGEALATGEDFELTYERDGQAQTVTIEVPEGGADAIGVMATTETYRPTLPEAARGALNYGIYVATTVSRLIQPNHTMEIVSQSSSVVGISVMASEAATSGIADLLMLVAAVSMSLGFMNLLPILPLDGGKIVVELVQAVIRRPVPLKVQAAITYVGLAFFVFVFLFALRNDLTAILGM